jgi:hypothetical protein
VKCDEALLAPARGMKIHHLHFSFFVLSLKPSNTFLRPPIQFVSWRMSSYRTATLAATRRTPPRPIPRPHAKAVSSHSDVSTCEHNIQLHHSS